MTWERRRWHSAEIGRFADADEEGADDAHLSELGADEEGDPHYRDDCPLEEPTEANPANLVSSLCTDGLHRPVLDLDIPVVLSPSATPGHHHLYLNTVALEWDQYVKLLEVLAECGIVEVGWVRACVDRHQQTLVRVPGVPRPPRPPAEDAARSERRAAARTARRRRERASQGRPAVASAWSADPLTPEQREASREAYRNLEAGMREVADAFTPTVAHVAEQVATLRVALALAEAEEQARQRLFAVIGDDDRSQQLHLAWAHHWYGADDASTPYGGSTLAECIDRQTESIARYGVDTIGPEGWEYEPPLDADEAVPHIITLNMEEPDDERF